MFTFNFPAVKGIQAGKDYFIAMVPLGLVSKLFHNEEEFISPEYRAQRKINEARIPEMRDYILSNRSSYVFSALSASIDGEFEFIPQGGDANLGILKVNMDAVFVINDGQHRKAAIAAAISEDPSLRDETISIVFFKDEGLHRSQQMFADLNKHAVKSTKSLSTLYDNRDGFSNAVKSVIASVPFLNKYVDKENDNLGKNAFKLFTLANFSKSSKRIVKEEPISEDAITFLSDYWNLIFSKIVEWEMLENKELPKCSLREDYILTLAVTLNAFGRLGRYIFEHRETIASLNRLKDVDWSRANIDWKNRAIDERGKIINTEAAVIKICNYIKLKLGLELNREELIKEKEV